MSIYLPPHPFAPKPRHVIDPLNYRSEYAALTAGQLAHIYGVPVFPTHGIRWNNKTRVFECTCMGWRSWKSEQDKTVPAKCPSPGKLPRIKGWPENASTDLDQLVIWHRQQPFGNWGAVTGTRSNLVVLDADGHIGEKNLAALFHQIGGCPPTWKTQSGSQVGSHTWFRPPSGVTIRNSASAIALGIDVRGENGQIIVPGSRHKSGNFYRWMDGCAPDQVELAEMPPELVQICLDACKKTRTSVDTAPPRPRTPARTANRVSSGDHDPESLLIGDGPGRGGFHGPINRNAVKYFGRFGLDADREQLKHSLRTAILSAPRDNHDDADIERYSSKSYLDEAIESAHAYVGRGRSK